MILPVEPHFQDFHPDAENFVQSALDTLPAHIAILDSHGNISGVNSAWRQIVADSTTPLLHHGLDMNYLAVCGQYAHFDLPPPGLVADALDELLDGYRELLEIEYSRDDRRFFVLRARRFLCHDELRVIVAHENITPLKRAQRQVNRQEIDAQAILDQIRDGVLLLDMNGEIQSCNAAAERIFGYRRVELSGMCFTHLQNESDANHGMPGQLLREGACKLIGKRRDGSTFPMRVTIERPLSNRGDLVLVIIKRLSEIAMAATDSLPIEHLRAKLREERNQRDLKDRYLSMMSHELRTPLASIQLSHDLLAHYSERASAEERQQYLDNIRLQVMHLNEIVSDVVSLSRSSRSALDFNPVRHDLVAFCRNMVNSFQINHGQTHQITFDCCCSEVSAEFDLKLLRRALTNLLGNAVKYSPDGGRVHLSLRRDGDQAHIAVSDEGIGIPAEDADFLFMAFHRASNVGSLPGTGLGLAIAKQALDIHRGRISFSTKIGIGTTFEIGLPLRIAPAHSTATSLPEPRNSARMGA